MKKSPNKSRYLRIVYPIFGHIPINYTEKERKKIVSYFPKEKEEAALKETTEHVSKLVSWLCSKTTPENIKRKERNQQLLSLRNCLLSLEKQLDSFSQQGGYQIGYELKSKFDRLYPRTGLGDFQEMISSLMLVCTEIISPRNVIFDESKLQSKNKSIVGLIKRSMKGLPLSLREAKRLNKFLIKKGYFSTHIIQRNSDRPGRKNPAYYDVVGNLANTWKKYIGKEPTLHNKTTDINTKTGKRTKQEPSGSFLKYITVSITSAFNYVNKEYKKRLHLSEPTCKSKVSLANIARDVIRSRKGSMAKISSK